MESGQRESDPFWNAEDRENSFRAVSSSCLKPFCELFQFMISSPLNSIESDRRGRCLTRTDLINGI